VVAIEEYTLLLLRARTSAAFADLQVMLLRDLASRLATSEASTGDGLRVQATADQLEAAARESRRAVHVIANM
jgi:hypothetical protein